MIKLLTYFSLITFIVFNPLLSHAENFNKFCTCSDITPVKLWDADAWLWLSSDDKEISINKHLPWGTPVNPNNAGNERLLIQRHYILNYDGDLRTSTWAAHTVKKSDVEKQRNRTECFRKDNRVRKSHAGLCADYKEPTFDQGHLVPNSDMKRTLRAMLNTYVMSNMAPQHCNFNRGSWLVLEGLVRNWAVDKSKLFIITGAVFDRDGSSGRDTDNQALRMVSNNGNERVAIPSHFYKILLHKISNSNIESLSIMLPHTNEKLPGSSDDKDTFYKNNIVSIDEIEQVTGINFLPDLEISNPTLANKIESTKQTELWTLAESWPNRLDTLCN